MPSGPWTAEPGVLYTRRGDPRNDDGARLGPRGLRTARGRHVRMSAPPRVHPLRYCISGL